MAPTLTYIPPPWGRRGTSVPSLLIYLAPHAARARGHGPHVNLYPAPMGAAKNHLSPQYFYPAHMRAVEC